MRPDERLSDSKTSLNGSKIDFPPEYDEIEVSLFGPGYGESVLLHMGENQWIIVDSCIDPVSDTPVPLSYLRKINIDPTTAVKQIIATHWHDDHIRGLAAIFKECETAEFVCSGALKGPEFLTIVRAYAVRQMMLSTGINEFSEIIKLLKDRASSKKNKFFSLKFAIADRCLHKKNFGKSFAIYSLSPSDTSVLLTKIEIGKLIPEVGETKKRVASLTPNHAAVVLLVIIGNDSILLGSDLEETGDLATGWRAIINSGTRPQEKASFFKVPHHGSVTADNPQIWSLMLNPGPISGLTPFLKGKIFLPSKDDVARICNYTEKAFSTGVARHFKQRDRARMVEKQIKEIGVKLRPIYCSPGQVRARGKLIDNKIDWNIHLIGGAIHLKEVYN